jgi:hypothetical protein
MRPGDAYWEIVRPVWNAISICNLQRFQQEFAEAPLIARTLFAVHWCQSEVCNGGFYQFFYNSTGILAPEASASFQTIDMPQTASVVVQAMNWFGQPYPRRRRDRVQRLEAVEGKKQFRPLDEEFFRLIETENGGFLAAADAYARPKFT